MGCTHSVYTTDCGRRFFSIEYIRGGGDRDGGGAAAWHMLTIASISIKSWYTTLALEWQGGLVKHTYSAFATKKLDVIISKNPSRDVTNTNDHPSSSYRPLAVLG